MVGSEIVSKEATIMEMLRGKAHENIIKVVEVIVGRKTLFKIFLLKNCPQNTRK
jgi:hypothetical protein